MQKKIATLGLTLGVLAAGVGVAGASTITWTGGALAGLGTTTISTQGAFVEAHNVGEATATAAGPITFDALAATPFTNTYLDFLPVGLTSNAAFDSVLDSGAWENAFTDAVLTLTGLTSGRTYLAQFFVADTRDSFSTRTVTVIAGNSMTSGLLGLGWVFNGTFTADATTQSITFRGGGTTEDSKYAYLNASQLRDITANDRGIDAVPEPATLVLFGTGLMGLAALRRRKARR